MDVESLQYTSKLSLPREKSNMVRPLSRKDIFYSGSVVNLQAFHQSQKSLTNYRQSILSIPKMRGVEGDYGTRTNLNPVIKIMKLINILIFSWRYMSMFSFTRKF